ncbi:hypothetical protein BGZ63DRAFT_455260 [Mariannaea sp. PMI_226]|nr:hypothetical protein BGZ63DRAFT_455260 [Mariannaea sp. PMI_226]
MMDRPPLWTEAFSRLPQTTQDALKVYVQAGDESRTEAQNVDALVKALSGRKEQYEHKFKIREKVYKIMDYLQKVKEIGDTVVSFDPVHAAIPWAGFRFLLMTALAHRDNMEAIITSLEEISRLLQYGKDAERQYLSGDRRDSFDENLRDGIRNDLVALYVAILHSLHYCSSELKKSTARQMISAPFKLGMDQVFKPLQSRWKMLAERITICQSERLLQQSSALNKLLIKMEEAERIKTLEGISNIRFAGHHSTVSQQRTPGTGQWILDTREFQQWKNMETSFITLLFGGPGAGKTFLISSVIDHVKQHLDDSGTDQGFAYFYCNRSEENRRKPSSIMAAIVRQLSSPIGRAGEIHQGVQELYRSIKAQSLILDVRMCQDILLELIKSYTSTTIILDALDECDRDSRIELMDSLDELMNQTSRLKVFISSRKDYDIDQHFKSQPKFEIKAANNQNDIENYVNQKLLENKHLKHQPKLQSIILDRLLAQNEGMFQFVALQLQRILRLKFWHEEAVEDCLRTLPSTMDDMYQLIWTEIREQPGYQRRLAERAIQWVVYAAEPLSTKRLATAMRLDPCQDAVVDSTEDLRQEEISGLCCNLLSFDQKGRVWRICHLSAREDIEKYHRLGPDPYCDVAKVCLNYLLAMCAGQIKFETFQSTGVKNLGSYIVGRWPSHVRSAEQTHDLTSWYSFKALLQQFLGSLSGSSPAYQTWANRMKRTVLRDKVWIDGNFHKEELLTSDLSCYAIVAFGLGRTMTEWHEDDPTFDLNSRNEEGSTLLTTAARYNQRDIYHWLLEKNVDINGGDNSALFEACAHGHTSLAADLIKAGADVNRPGEWDLAGDESTPLHRAIEGQNLQLLQLLLENKADLDVRVEDRTALDFALGMGSRKMISLLVQYGARIGNAQIALKGAAQQGLVEWLTPCLEAGANVNGTEFGFRPLILVAQNNHVQAAKVLLEKGADIDVKDYMGRTALAVASQGLHIDIMKFLLEQGANPNAGRTTSPLCLAVTAIQIDASPAKIKEAVSILLDAGADINLVDPFSHSTVLAKSIEWKYRGAEIIEFLLNMGADPNLGGCVLAATTRRDPNIRSMILPLLFMAGVDLNYDHGIHNCLCMASRLPYDSVKKLERLIALGADPTLTFNEDCGSALATAAFHQNFEAVHFFLQPELGIDPNASLRGWFNNSLFAAIAGYELACQENLDLGFSDDDSNSPEGLEIIQLLLESGAEMPFPRNHTPTEIYTVRLYGRDSYYFINATRAFYKETNGTGLCFISTEWVRILWELDSGPLPRPPLSPLVERCGLPCSLPPSVCIFIKLTRASRQRASKYAVICISKTSSGRYIYVKQRKRFQPFQELKLITVVSSSGPKELPEQQEHEHHTLQGDFAKKPPSLDSLESFQNLYFLVICFVAVVSWLCTKLW